MSEVVDIIHYIISVRSDPLVAFDRAISEVIGRYVLITVLHSRSGDKQRFDAGCRSADDAKQTAFRA